MFEALKNGPFLRISVCSLLLTLAFMTQEVVLGFQLYAKTKDPLALGLLGLAEAVPFMLLALFGGHLADRVNRRSQMLLMLALMLLSACVLAHISPALDSKASAAQNLASLDMASHARALWVIYGMTALTGFARGLYSPAAASLRAQLVPADLQANASAWSSTFWQVGMLSAPVIAGYALHRFGLQPTLYGAVVFIGATWLLTLSLPSLRAQKVHLAEPTESLFASIRTGFRFVYTQKILFYSIALDLVAVLFGGVVAILPAFAADVLKVGPEQLGWLRTAPGVGAVLTMVLAAKFSPALRPWRNMLIAVTGFGICTLVFALSESYWLSFFALAATGVFDGISVVVRQYLLQSVPPDHMRGRVLSVNSIFVSASNEIGAFESGVAAKYLGLRSSVLAGACLTLLSAIWLYGRGRQYQLGAIDQRPSPAKGAIP
jgi:MFS family permease